MGWWDKLFGRIETPAPYVTDEAVRAHVDDLVARLPGRIAQLRGLGVSDDDTLGLEVSFLTNRRGSAERLAGQLQNAGFAAAVDGAGHLGGLHAVTALTPPMLVDEARLEVLLRNLSALGEECDCMLEGWDAGGAGTAPGEA